VISNVLGGKFDEIQVTTAPAAQPRSYGFGVAVHQPHMWVFSDPVVALEFSDIGNNPDGSLFRTVHLGGEMHYGLISPRLGLNQGYISAGLGVDLKFLQIDLATYGEETSLNVGGAEDRRYAIRLGFQI
jgi:hypothetical protein